MIKMKDLITEKLSKSDIKKMRDKFNKTGKLPPHLKKLADLMDKHKEVEDIVVPGLEWMNDIPVKEIYERMFGTLNEAKMVQLQIKEIEKKKVKKILDKLRLKMGKNYDFGAGKGSTFILELDTKFEDKVLELLVKNRIQVSG